MAAPLVLLSSSAWLDSSDHSTRVWAPLPAYATALLRALDSPLSLVRRAAPVSRAVPTSSAEPPSSALPVSRAAPVHKGSHTSPSQAPITSPLETLATALTGARGHWSLISSLGESILLATDRMRSLGLLYAFDGQRWIITDDVNSLLARPH